MKNLVTITFIAISILLAVTTSFANNDDIRKKKIAATVATHNPISPKVFVSIESYMKRNFPEHWSDKFEWTASEEGFKKLGPRGGYLLIRWNGKLVFKILDKAEYWIGNWNEKGEVH
jgi:hypothetical protein